jgi:hypothetical protein
MRVALAEDGALFREWLLLLLRAAGQEIVGSTVGGNELMCRGAGSTTTSPHPGTSSQHVAHCSRRCT